MFDLDMKATIYNAGRNDGFGGFAYERFVIDCKYAQTAKKMTDADGNEMMATSVIYSKSPALQLNSKVYFGVSDSIEPPSSARDTKAVKSNQSFTDMVVAWLE